MLVSQSFEARCTGRSRDRRDQSQYLSRFNLDVGPVRIVRSMLPPRRILPQRFIIADGPPSFSLARGTSVEILSRVFMAVFADNFVTSLALTYSGSLYLVICGDTW